MIKKIVKNIYMVALMFFMLGTICLVPSLSTKKYEKTLEQQVAVADSGEDLKVETKDSTTSSSMEQLWSDMFISMDSYDLTTVSTSLFSGMRVYKIASAEDLAYLAYAVNNNDTTINSTSSVFIQTADINLEGKVWTPIGDGARNKFFVGTYIGQGYTISNINVSDIAVSGTSIGLFGNVSGSITEVRLSGYFQTNITSGDRGELVGYLPGGNVLGCFDGMSSSLNVIGTNHGGRVGASSGYYRYNNNLDSASWTSYTSGQITGAYKLGYIELTDGGSFYKLQTNGSGAVWKEGKIIRICYSGTTIQGLTNSIFADNTIVLRENLSATGQIFPLRAGYRYTIPDVSGGNSASAGTRSAIAATASSINVTFDYQYGEENNKRIISLSIPYDTTFGSYFIGKDYLKQRAGYTFNGLFTTSSFENQREISQTNITSAHYQNSYPSANSTYYPKFTANGNIDFKVIFAISSDDNSPSLDSRYNLIQKALEGNSLTKGNSSDTINTDGSTAYDYDYRLATRSGANDMQFTITLNKGFKINTSTIGSGSALSVSSSSTNYFSDNKTSGTYLNFTESTGKGADYKVNGNNDDYLPVAISASASGYTYTFTISNLANDTSLGEVYIVIEREYFSVDITPKYVRSNSFPYSWTLTQGQGYFTVNDVNKGTATGRQGNDPDNPEKPAPTIKFFYKLYENYSLVLDTALEDEDNMGVILVIPGSTNGYGISYAPGDSITIENSNGESRTYDTLGIVTFYSSPDDSDTLTLINNYQITIGTLVGKVTVNAYLGSPEDSSPLVVNDDINSLSYGISVSLNDNSENANRFINTTEDVNINYGLDIDTDTAYVQNNGYYKVYGFRINGGDFISSSVIIPEPNSEDNITTISYRFLLEAYTGEESSIITIDFYFTEQTYDILTNVYIGGTNGTNFNVDDYNGHDLYTISFSKSDSSKAGITDSNKPYNFVNADYGQTIVVTLTLTNLGKQLLYWGEDATIASGDTKGGYFSSTLQTDTQSASSGTWTFTIDLGTYDTALNIYFNFKQVNFTINELYLIGAGLLSENSGISQFNSTLTFNYAKIGDNFAISLGSPTNSSITIHSQYYLLGWYLKNGNVEILVTNNSDDNPYQVEFNSYFSDSNVLNDVLTESEKFVNAKSFDYNGVAAAVRQRTVSIVLDSGDEGSGQIYYSSTGFTGHTYNNDNWQDEKITHTNSAIVYYGIETSLDDVFRNIGYTFNGWTWSVNGASYSNSITIPNADWYNLFGGNENVSWNALYSSESTDFSHNSTSTIILTAVWNINTYIISIDNTNSLHIQIGNTLTFTTNDTNRNGQAGYSTNTATGTNGAQGTLINGYLATGFTMKGIGSNTNTIIQTRADGSNTIEFKFDVDAAKAILLDSDSDADWMSYYFMVNDSTNNITITTNRIEATYKIYINTDETYYSVSWNDSTGSYVDYGGQDDFGVYVSVKYDSIPLDVFNNVLNSSSNSDGPLVITRVGYRYNTSRWYRTDTSIDTLRDFNTANTFLITEDIEIVPRWERTSTTAIASIDWAEDVDGLNEFYLYNEHNIINGVISGNNQTDDNIPNVGDILTNGERITSFRFTITGPDGKEITSSTLSNPILNIVNFLKAGDYQVTFTITVEDMLQVDPTLTDYSRSYSVTNSLPLNFTMKKNVISFVDNNIHSYYTGTTEYLPVTDKSDDENSDTGLFTYLNWKGETINTAGEGIVDNAFQNYSMFESSGNYNVGTDKQFKMYFNRNIFGSTLGSVYSDLFENVVQEGSNYYIYMTTDADTVINIEKAKFTINVIDNTSNNQTEEFNGSAYYFAGVTTIVYTNPSRNFTFRSGNSTFTYTYYRITLHEGAQIGEYIGAEDHTTDNSNFVILSLAINGQDDPNQNFEWNLSTDFYFNLLDPANAVQYTYESRYLVASVYGALEPQLTNTYRGQTETFSIQNIRVNGAQVSSRTDEQDNISYNDNILLSFVNNNSSNLLIYINEATLRQGVTLTFDIVVNLSSDRAQSLTVLYWDDSANGNSSYYESYLDNTFPATTTNTVTASSARKTVQTYAVLTDVVKVNVDYNGGTRENNSTETYYISAMNGGYNLSNPTHSYEGLSFNNYSDPNSTDITITPQDDSNLLTVNKGGRAVNIVASWKFNYIVAEGVSSLERQASVSGFELPVSDFATISFPDKVISTSYLLVHDSSIHGELNFDFDSTKISFLIQNTTDKMAVTSMSGDYTFTLTVTYHDNVQPSPQTRTFTWTFNLDILINYVGIERNPNSNLTFNDQVRDGEITIINRLNSQLGEEGFTTQDILLSNMPKSDNSGTLGYYVTILSQTYNYTTVRGADTYIISIVIHSRLSEVYAIEEGKGTITLVVDEYTINLGQSQYTDQINLSKYFGEADPQLKATLTVSANNNDSITVWFTRDTQSQGYEQIGLHRLTYDRIDSPEDDRNYEINVTSPVFIDNFEILVPNSYLQVELLNHFEYTYNGYVFENLTIEYDEDSQKFYLKGNANDTELSIEFLLYYRRGNGDPIYVPIDQRALYASYFTFSRNVVENPEYRGEYIFTVALTQNATDVGWAGIEITNTDNAKIVVNARNITITEAIKTFDQTTEFKYNNKKDLNSGNTITLTIDNIVQKGGVYDEVEISGKFASELAGSQEINENEIHIDNAIAINNYNLSLAEGLKIKVIPSTETVTMKSTVSSLEYGKLSRTTSLETFLSLIPLTYTGTFNTKILNKYISNVLPVIDGATYSNGNYLQVVYDEENNVTHYVFRYTLSSINFTFGDPITDEGDSYSKEYTLNITITQKAITINNAQGFEITKQYDGDAVVEDAFVGKNVNADGGYFTSSGILDGDFITINSANYNNREIGVQKPITVSNYTGDYLNYAITENIKGSITSILLTFKKNVQTESWVNDNITDFGNTQDITFTYAGDKTALMNALKDTSTYTTRIGYTQQGWEYNNKQLEDYNEDDIETLLKDAVDVAHGLESEITLDAIWQIKTYTVTINEGNYTNVTHTKFESGTTSVNETLETTVNYWDTISDIAVDAKEGYTFEDVELSKQKVCTLSMTNQKTNKGSFTLTNITDNLTATIKTEEITVRIVIDTNNPEPGVFDVITSSTGWTNGNWERVLSYSELRDGDLPIVKMNVEPTYNFVNWKLNNADSTKTSIWERIKEGGYDFTQDADQDDGGFTFVAQWEEAPVTITININGEETDHGQVTVRYNNDVGQEISPVAGMYNIHFNDTISFSIASDAWYKWTGMQITGSAAELYKSITGDSSATDARNGAFILGQVRANLVINITIDPINVTINTQYSSLLGADIVDTDGSTIVASGDISGVWTVESGKTTIKDVVPYYTPEAGTYVQTNWTYNLSNIDADDLAQDTISQLLGSVPTRDTAILLTAEFEGLDYTVTFEKGVSTTGEIPVFTGDDAGLDRATRTWKYGSLIQNIPNVDVPGEQYIWRNEIGESYSNNQYFITSNPNADLTMTITASWNRELFNITVDYGGNKDKISGVTLDGMPYIEGTQVEGVVWGTSKVYEFTLATGYEIDQTATNASLSQPDLAGDYDEATIEYSVSGNVTTVTIINIQGNTTLTVVIKAKDFTITIDVQTPETIAQDDRTYAVKYDQDITNLFTGKSYTRLGYEISSFRFGSDTFATKGEDGTWTFDSKFVNASNQYNYEGNITLRAVWTSTNTYVNAVLTPQSGLVFNNTNQTIATASVTTLTTDETIAVGKPLANGDKVIDIYYMLGSERLSPETDFSVLYRNAMNGELKLYVALQDTLKDSGDTITYTYVTDGDNVQIAKSKIIISGANLITYYSGTKTFNVTDDLGFNAGTFAYSDSANTAISELIFSRVDLIDFDSREFSVGSGYNVTYYFTVTGNFDINNYDGLTQVGSLFAYNPVAPENATVTATVVQTPIEVTISGKGFENGENHQVINYQVTSQPTFVRDFTVNINSIYTNGSIANVYDVYSTVADESELIMSWQITKDESDKSSNFVINIAGNYEIVDEDEGFRITAGVKYFVPNIDLTQAQVTDNTSINITITAFTYNGSTQRITTTNDFFNYVDSASGNLVFSIAKNGTNNPIIRIANGQSVAFTFEIDGTMEVLGWTNDVSTSNLTSLLQNLTTTQSRSNTPSSFNAQSSYYAVLTDYKAVKLSLGDKGGDQGFIYVQLGGTAEAVLAEENKWTGFEFRDWFTDTSTVSANGNTISAAADSTILTTTIIANWNLLNPTGTVVDGGIVRDAKAQYNADTDAIDLADLLVKGIENRNDDAITYAFSWKRNGIEVWTSENGWTVKANTTSNSSDEISYSLEITATRDGYQARRTTFNFDLNIARLTITGVSTTNTEFVYANKDYAGDITFAFTGDKLGFSNVTLDTLLNASADLPYYFTMTGISTTEIKNAGEYILTLNLDSTIFNDYTYSETITISKAPLVITQSHVDDAGLNQKIFGEADPTFTFTVVMFTGANPETITINLSRANALGAVNERVGSHKFTSVSTPSNANFDVTLDTNGVYFTITQANYELIITLDEALSMVYNGQAPNFTLSYSNGRWVLAIGESTSTITLSFMLDEQEHFLSGTLYEIALEDYEISMPNSIDVGTYTNFGISVKSGAEVEFNSARVVGSVEITKLGLEILSVSKVFDRTATINDGNYQFANKVIDDEVILTGNFSQAEAGQNLTLNTLAISGKDAGNYYIANNDFNKAEITPLAVTNVSIQFNNALLTYGDLYGNTSLNNLLTMTSGVTINIDGVTSDLSNNFITVSSWSANSADLSLSGSLKAGNKAVTIVITSTNFSGISEDGYSVQLTIQRQELDLSWLAIVKNYDSTTDLPDSFSGSLDGYIEDGDDVSIDEEASKYASAEVGTHKVTIDLTGDDAVNYTVKDNVTGIINKFSINFIVVANEENEDLVTDGEFVEDGLTPIVTVPTFSFEYPINESADDMISRMTYPTRKGYKVVGWKYLSGDNYISITAENIESLLSEIAYTDDDATINVYTVWEIEYYNMTVKSPSAQLASFTITARAGSEGYVLGDAQSGYTVRYFADININVTGNRGYKVAYYNMTAGDSIGSNFNDVGNNIGTAIIEKVGNNITLDVYFEDILITFVIDPNIPNWTSQTGTEVDEVTLTYSELESLVQGDLPRLTVTDGTYYLDSYSYMLGASRTPIGTNTLMQIVDQAYPTLLTDSSVQVSANWLGENYTIYFNANGGELSSDTPINAVYGSAFTQPFPTASMTGKSNLWVAPDGVYYKQDGSNEEEIGEYIFHSIGSNSTGDWTITLTAEWVNNPYTLTIEFDDKISVNAYGNEITSGFEYDIIYEEGELVITVTPNTGYVFEIVDEADFKGQITRDENNSNVITIKNLYEDDTLTLQSLPGDNTINIYTENVESFTVKINDEEAVENLNEFIAKTESTITLVFNATKGYEFNPADASKIYARGGSITATTSEDKKTLYVTWIDFVTDATLNVSAEPSTNIVTIPDISAYFSGLTFNGQSILTTGTTYSIKTGQTIQVVATLNYGYTEPLIETTPDFVTAQDYSWINRNSVYELTATIEGINESFTINMTAKARTFNFNVSVKEGQETYGEITSQTTLTADFGETISLSQNTLAIDYIFSGWEIFNTIISTDSPATITIDSSLKDLLEAFGHDQTVLIFATYKEKIFSVSFRTGSRGNYSFYQDGMEPVSVTAGNTVIRELNLGSNIIINLNPDDGYEFNQLMFDGEVATNLEFTYDEVAKTLTIPVDVNNPMGLIEVSFKASEAYVTVRAGIMVNYVENLGSNEGGVVYLVDRQGERLDDSYYLENNGVRYIGYDYQVQTYTDETLYFVMEPRSGFSGTMRSDSSRVTHSEFTVNGKQVHSFSGVHEGANIYAVFTANENVINIVYVLEGSTEPVMAGKTYVETSSALVTASGNGTHNTKVTAITDSDLIATVNSGISYNLARNEDGTVKYQIVYTQGEDEFVGEILFGQVIDTDIMQTGFSNSADISITDVNTDATIYIYVTPKVYNLRFYINENDSVVLDGVLTYGREFSLNGLTDEQRALIFQQRTGFTLQGYYTMQQGYGTCYVDRQGRVTGPWLEESYVVSGSTYVAASNFDEATDTFTIYAAWLYNKSTITIDFMPSGFSDKLSNVSITDVIINIDTSTAWLPQDNKWYAEVNSGISLTLQAYEYEGYEFMYWLVSMDGGEPVQMASTFQMQFPQGNYVIQAIYYPKFTMEIETLNSSIVAGTSSVVQDGTILTGSTFDPNKEVTLEATVNEGYNFLYWENTETGEKIYGEYDIISEKTTYTFDTLLTEPLYLKAVYEGKNVNITLDYQDVILHHELEGVYLNGELVENDTEFNAKVGDKIEIVVRQHQGYGFEMVGGDFKLSSGADATLVYGYDISAQHLTQNGDEYDLDLVFKSTRENIRFQFNAYVNNAVSNSEYALAGRLRFVDANGVEQSVSTNNTYDTPFGQTVYLKIDTLSNYEIADIYVQTDYLYNITDRLTENGIVIDENFMETYFNYNISINVYFNRLVWIEGDFEEYALQGEGTEDSPFLINDVNDFAYVAYLVNNGIMLNEDTKYSECYYRVTNNINFSGKYWEPIGTEENPFNGYMYLGRYQMSNIVHYTTYSNPSTSYNGLFWHLGENAEIVQSDNTLVVILSVIGGIILLIALIILIIFIIRRNRKKELDEIANN